MVLLVVLLVVLLELGAKARFFWERLDKVGGHCPWYCW